MAQKIVVTQTRSEAGRTKELKRTLKALGLGKIGKSRTYVMNDALKGMLRSVGHLVEIKEGK